MTLFIFTLFGAMLGFGTCLLIWMLLEGGSE